MKKVVRPKRKEQLQDSLILFASRRKWKGEGGWKREKKKRLEMIVLELIRNPESSQLIEFQIGQMELDKF